MSRPIANIVGAKFGRLTVVERAENKSRYACWLCKCDCGNIVIVRDSDLKVGGTKSCGCFRKDKVTKHNLCGTRIYHIYHDILKRCYNKNSKRYDDYGGRGISMCEEWRNDFKRFYDWCVSNGYQENLTIDRIDNSGNYEPKNCRWVDFKTQARNRKSNHIIEFNGERMLVVEFSEKYNINYSTVLSAIKRNDNLDNLLRRKRERELKKENKK